MIDGWPLWKQRLLILSVILFCTRQDYHQSQVASCSRFSIKYASFGRDESQEQHALINPGLTKEFFLAELLVSAVSIVYSIAEEGHTAVSSSHKFHFVMTTNGSSVKFMIGDSGKSRPRGVSAISLSSLTDYEPLILSQEGREQLAAVLSALYAVILIIVALAFEVSIVAVDEIHSTRYDPFYLYLYGAGLLFFGYCYAFLLRSEGWNVPVPFYPSTQTSLVKFASNSVDSKRPTSIRKVTLSSHDAGSLYLRLGCVVFGVVALIANGFQLFVLLDNGSSSGCFSASTIAETSLATLYIFIQMFFIFQNSKLIIHRFTAIGRFGTMHLIATNLCMWIRSLVIEEWQVIHGIEENQLKSIPKNITVANQLLQKHNQAICAGKRKQTDAFLSDAKPFMTTCFIEYSIICSAIMYVLWRNIGGRGEKEDRSKERSRNKQLQVDCSASTRGLFLGLLFMIFTIISMVIFFTKVNSEHNYQALWVFYASDSILYIVAIFCLIMAMHKLSRLTYIPNLNQSSSLLLDDILLIVGLIGQLMICIFSVVALNNIGLTAVMIVITSILRMCQILMQTVFILFSQRLVSSTRFMQSRKPGRELVTFLIMTNLSMFLINTFQAQKAAANPLTSEFYGQGIWSVIVHSTVPLCTFYRFHSTVCLAEIWKKAYRTKIWEAIET